VKSLKLFIAVVALSAVFTSCSKDSCYTCSTTTLLTTEVCDGYAVTTDANGDEVQRLEIAGSSDDYVEILQVNPAFTCVKK
jgi:hypothetical protein